MRAAAVSVLVMLAVLATSCAIPADGAGESADAETGQSADAETGSVVEVDAAAAEPVAEVDLVRFSFEPEVIEIDVGDAVRWSNGDATRHTVTAGVDAEPTGAFHLSFDGRGDSAALTFTEPGEYRYFCTPHPFMQGTIRVRG